MLDRIRDALTSEPWRTAAITLAIALLVTLVWGLTRGSAGNVEATIDATTTSTVPTATSTSVSPGAGLTTSTTIDDSGNTDGHRAGVELGVKVDNAPPARPQWGLRAADLLVEYPVEGGLTRFAAMFPAGLDGIVGPVRSLRPVDADLLKPLASLVASSGGQPFVIQDMEASGILNIMAQVSSVFPSVGNPDPYDTFVDLGLLEGLVGDAVPPVPGLPIGTLPPGGERAIDVELPFAGVNLRYESATGYTRYEGDLPYEVLDLQGENSTPLTHDVAVVIYAAERSAGYADVNGFGVSTFDVIGGDDLLVFSGGNVFRGSWSRNAQEDGFEFWDDLGNPVGLPEGRVYMAVVPRDSQVSYHG